MTQAFNLSQLANNLNTSGQLDATDGLTGAVPVANGGTGQSTLTANAVILGNGTSGVQTVAPSTSGNVLVSNGTTWVSQAPTGGGVTSAVAGNGISVSGATGAVTFSVACPSANTVGSYAFGTGRTTYPTNFAFGKSCSVGSGNGQVGLASVYDNGGSGVFGTNTNYSDISGTWRWLGVSFYISDRQYAIICRIA